MIDCHQTRSFHSESDPQQADRVPDQGETGQQREQVEGWAP